MKKDNRGFYRESGTVNGVKYDIRAKTQAELKEKVRNKIREIEDGMRITDKNTTVQEWAEQWRITYKTSLRQASSERIVSQLRNYIIPVIGYLPISKVLPLHCQDVLNRMEGKSVDTVKKVRSLLFNIFDSAQKNHLIRSNPAQDLTLPACKATGTHRSMTERERTILLAAASEHATGPIWLTMLYTGLRPEEILPLTGADILNGHIRVNKAVEARTGIVKPPKSKAGIRSIPIPQALQTILPTVKPFALLFPQKNGHMMTATVLRRHWKAFYAAMADKEKYLLKHHVIGKLTEALPPLVPYDLRHTYCTDLERAGVPINIASKLMGHANINITSKIYTHTEQTTIDAAAVSLQSLYDSSPVFSPTDTGVKRCNSVVLEPKKDMHEIS